MRNPVQTKCMLAIGIAALLLAGQAQGASRAWTYTYHTTGLLATADGPRTDVSDVVSYTYDTNGRLTQVQNALSQITTLSSFDSYGRPQTITDPNGIATALAYTTQGWLASSTTAGSTTSFQHDAIGQITRVTLGDGSWLEYTWDSARRITAVENNLGERIEYTLDAQGNRTSETVRDSASTLRRQQQRTFDELGRLLSNIGASAQTTQYSYDLNNNQTGLTDPKSYIYSSSFDALDRLVGTTDPLSGVTTRSYDDQNNLTQVVDPRGVTTTYAYDGLGNLTQHNSPDSGVTTFVHDAAGNVTQSTDARGIVTNYTYDALNRVLTRSYPASSSLNVQYGYDSTAGGNHGIGRLTSVQDASGTLAYTYDARGNLTGQARTMTVVAASLTESLGYTYDNTNRITRIDYPADFNAQYTRNVAGQITSIALQVGAGTPATLVSGVSYLPFGPAKALTWGNGLTLSRTYDQDYRLTQQTVGSTWTSSHALDANDNITQIGSSLWGTLDYGYDVLDRLISSQRAAQNIGYAYDAVGNRTEKSIIDIVGGVTEPAVTTSYTYGTSNNRLTAIGAQTVLSDASGNHTQDRADRVLSHDAQGRLQSATIGGALAASYKYNALGQRTHKVTPGGTTTYLYAQDGQLLGLTEHTAGGVPAKAQYYVWLDALPVAVVQVGYDSTGTISSTSALYLHADHLDTPRLATNASQTVVWRLPQTEAFGDVMAETDPDADSVQTDIALRFPGQVADAETGLHYNYFRHYDPQTGRYVQSDPIGLGGGINTYAYVNANPLSFIDQSGLRGGAPLLLPYNPGIRPPGPQPAPVLRPPPSNPYAGKQSGMNLIADSVGNIDYRTPSNLNAGSPIPGPPVQTGCTLLPPRPSPNMCTPYSEPIVTCGPVAGPVR